MYLILVDDDNDDDHLDNPTPLPALRTQEKTRREAQDPHLDKRMPVPSNASTVPALPNAGAFSPAGDSVYGMRDIVGHVWQYTDEFQDEHTRAVLLKGSSLYTPMLSDRFPSLPQPGNWSK